MARTKRSKLSGYLLIAAGIVFFLTALNGGKHAFTALGVVFVVLGVGALRRSKDSGDHSSGPTA